MIDTTGARRNTNKVHAIALAKIGVAVFPSSGKVPLVPRFNKLDTSFTPEAREAEVEKYNAEHDGKDPKFLGCTKDIETVKQMWRAFPDAVPSIACGPSNIVVVDADSKDNGPELVGKLFAENGGVPEGTFVSTTRSGGQHFVFADPNGAFTNSAGLLKKQYGCDVRGTGGQIIAPGSIREDGRTYGTRDDLAAFCRAFTSKQIPTLPSYIAELIGAAGEKSKSVEEAELLPFVRELEDTDWKDYAELFDPTLGVYDIEAYKAADPEFADAYDNPDEGNRSDARWKMAQFLLRKWRMPVCDLAVFFEEWEGSGSLTDDGEGAGNYNLRAIAREWYKNRDLFKSDGAAMGAVVDDDEDPELAEYSKVIEAERQEEREEKAAELRGEMYYANDAAFYTPADYVIQNVCTPGQIIVLYGASNVGKTFAVIHMGDCVSDGRDYFGKHTEKSGVLYMFAEGKGQFNNRLNAYRLRYPSEGKGMLVHKGIPPIKDKVGIKAFMRAIDDANKWQEENGLPPVRLVFIDTWAKAIAGAEENNASAMQPILNDLRKAAEKKGVCVVIVAHTGKDTTAGARGSYAVYADADAELELFDAATAKRKKLKLNLLPNQIAILSDKFRDGRKGGILMFRLEEIEIGKDKWGAPATSVVVVPDMPSTGDGLGAVVDDEEPGVTADQLTADQNRTDEAKRISLLAKVRAVMSEAGVSKIVGNEVQAPLAVIESKLKVLANLKAESGSNYARELKALLFKGEPAELLDDGWLRYRPGTGRAVSCLVFSPKLGVG